MQSRWHHRSLRAAISGFRVYLDILYKNVRVSNMATVLTTRVLEGENRIYQDYKHTLFDQDRTAFLVSITIFCSPNFNISKNTKYTLNEHTNTHVRALCVQILRCEFASVALSPKAGIYGQQKEFVRFII